MLDHADFSVNNTDSHILSVMRRTFPIHGHNTHTNKQTRTPGTKVLNLVPTLASSWPCEIPKTFLKCSATLSSNQGNYKNK